MSHAEFRKLSLTSAPMTGHSDSSNPNDRHREAGSRSGARVASTNPQRIAPVVPTATNYRPVGLAWSFVSGVR